MEEKYFFEKEIYSKNYNFSFPVDKELLNTILKLKKEGKVLDIGIGDGGTSLKLAELNFDVTCVDISKTCIEAIKREAEKRKIKINAICCDIENFEFNENYDVIIAMGVLHFLNKLKVRNFLEILKDHTNKGGINIIEAFLKGSRCERGSEGYYFSKDELIRIYDGWEILEREIYEDEDKNICEFLVLRKP